MIGQAHLRTFRTRDLPGPYACAEPINGPLQEENAETIADEQQPRNRRQNANRDGRGWKRSNAPADRFRTQFQTSFGGGALGSELRTFESVRRNTRTSRSLGFLRTNVRRVPSFSSSQRRWCFIEDVSVVVAFSGVGATGGSSEDGPCRMVDDGGPRWTTFLHLRRRRRFVEGRRRSRTLGLDRHLPTKRICPTLGALDESAARHDQWALSSRLDTGPSRDGDMIEPDEGQQRALRASKSINPTETETMSHTSPPLSGSEIAAMRAR